MSTALTAVSVATVVLGTSSSGILGSSALGMLSPVAIALTTTNPVGAAAALVVGVGALVVGVVSALKSNSEKMQEATAGVTDGDFDGNCQADLPPGYSNRLTPDLHQFGHSTVAVLRFPFSEVSHPSGSAVSMSTAYLFNCYLELKDPDRRTAIEIGDKPPMSRRYKGDKLNKAQIMRELAFYFPEVVNAEENSVIRRHLTSAQELISNGWRNPKPLSNRQLPMAYRTLYGLCQAVIAAAGGEASESITRGISNPARKAAHRFQLIAALPDRLTEDQLVATLDECLKQHDDP